jgi:hypothetical protein
MCQVQNTTLAERALADHAQFVDMARDNLHIPAVVTAAKRGGFPDLQQSLV